MNLTLASEFGNYSKPEHRYMLRKLMCGVHSLNDLSDNDFNVRVSVSSALIQLMKKNLVRMFIKCKDGRIFNSIQEIPVGIEDYDCTPLFEACQ